MTVGAAVLTRERVAEVIATFDDGERRGSGYRATDEGVLTAAHVVDGARSVVVRFEADLPGEWTVEASAWWADAASDLGVVSIPARDAEEPLPPAQFGRVEARAAVLAVQAVGFPRWKLRKDDGTPPVDGDGGSRYRDAHHLVGTVAVLSNWREGTLEVLVPQPPAERVAGESPWEGMSGAALWVGDRIIGVLSAHHPGDGPARLAGARIDAGLERLGQEKTTTLRALLPCLPSTTGELPDVTPEAETDRVLGAYKAQLVDLAPTTLLDREAELDELVQFCAADEPYAWWQAGPWAGKTALMSWFALNPPAGVDIVSFFVTGRFAGQSDSDAFIEAMLEQLAAICLEPQPAAMGGSARRSHMLRLLQAAASRSGAARRRLLVLVDGLDEDSYAGAGDVRSSVAALLPRRLPPHVRVLVASRPAPGVPDDVPGDHPLRVVAPTPLRPSTHARGVQLAAKFELTRWLSGTEFQLDVLGLITASGGGLSVRDIEELTERPRFEVERLLSGQFGRTISARSVSVDAGSVDAARGTEQPAYGLSHETLRVLAEEQFGGGLADYRARIDRWARGYHSRQWPPETPLYLLRGYPRMLAAAGDAVRLTSLVCDRSRHDRMLDITGGDALAMAEIRSATSAVLDHPELDLLSMVKLAAAREDLAERNARVPAELPAIWMTVGFPERATALAHGIADIRARARAVTLMVPAAASRGDDWMERCATAAEQVATTIPHPGWRADALAQLAEAIARAGDHDRALRVAEQISQPSTRAAALRRLVPVIAAAGNRDQTRAIVTTAERVLAQVRDPAERAEARARLATAAAAAGLGGQARELLGRARQTARDVGRKEQRAQVLCRLAEAAVASGDLGLAEQLSLQIDDPGWRGQALASVVRAHAAAGDRERAARTVDQIADSGWAQEAASALVEGLANAGSITEALHLAREIRDPSWRAQAVLATLRASIADNDEVATTLALAKEAEQLSLDIPDDHSRAEATADLAVMLGAADLPAQQLDHAVHLAHSIPNAAWRLRALAGLAKRLADIGNLAEALQLARQAEHRARTTSGSMWRAQASTALVAALAGVGRARDALDLAAVAEQLTAELSDLGWRSKILADLVTAVTDAGDSTWALEIATAAENAAGGTTNQVHALIRLVTAVAVAGDRDRALQIATTIESLALDIPNDAWRNQALAQLVVAVTNAGDTERAMLLARHITMEDTRADAIIESISSLLDTPLGGRTATTPMLSSTLRRMIAETLTTSSWIQALPLVARFDVETARRACALMSGRPADPE